jgi:FkbM family methyltransferase
MHFWKRMPPEFYRRKIFVSTKSHRRYWTKSLATIHPDIFSAVNQWVKKGAVVWDIGANLGVFTFSAAIRAGVGGRVYAFEPELESASLMAHSLSQAIPSEAEVCIYSFAVGDQDGETRFIVSGYRSAASALEGFGRFGQSKSDRTRLVPMRTLDSLAKSLRPPDVIKIDVEGAENLVLEGAEKVIRSYQPTLIVEANGGEQGIKMEGILRSWNYKWESKHGNIIGVHSDKK